MVVSVMVVMGRPYDGRPTALVHDRDLAGTDSGLPRRGRRRDDAAMPDYGRFCPVALGSEVLADRWTPLILRELVLGNTRFNDIARGLPGHLPLAARAAAAPPRAQGRGRAVAVADRPGQRVPPHPGRQGPRAGGRWRSVAGRSSGCSTTSRPHDVDPVNAHVVDAPARRRRAAPAGPGRRSSSSTPRPSGRRSGWCSTAARRRCACSTPGFDPDLVVTTTTPALAEVFSGYDTWAERASPRARSRSTARRRSSGASRSGSCGARSPTTRVPWSTAAA